MSKSAPFREYKESGTAPLINIIGLLSSAFVISTVLGLIYNLIMWIIPLIYFNVLVVFVYGYFIAYISRYLNIVFKIRNKKISILITFIFSLMSIYLQWVSFIYIYSTENLHPFEDIRIMLDLLLQPETIVWSIIDINPYGTWEVGETTINGGILWFIWALEALLIIAIPLRLYLLFDIFPFSEKDNRWYKKRKIDKEFEYVSLRNHFLKSFYENPLEAINSMGKSDFRRHSNIYIYSDKNQRSYLIEIENVMVDSKSKKDYMEVLKPSHIDIQTVKKIQETFKII